MTTKAAPPMDRLESCNGLAKNAFINQPDTKFNPDGLFKIRLVCDISDASVQAFKARVDAAVAEAFQAEVPAIGRDHWKHFLPYEIEDAGKSITFEFKRNAVITLMKTRERVALSVGVFDSTGTAVLSPPPIGDGSLVRVFAQFRPVKITAARSAGVRMDFSAIKVLRLVLPPTPFSGDRIGDGWRAP